MRPQPWGTMNRDRETCRHPGSVIGCVPVRWDGEIGWGSWTEPTQPTSLHGESLGFERDIGHRHTYRLITSSVCSPAPHSDSIGSAEFLAIRSITQPEGCPHSTMTASSACRKPLMRSLPIRRSRMPPRTRVPRSSRPRPIREKLQDLRKTRIQQVRQDRERPRCWVRTWVVRREGMVMWL